MKASATELNKHPGKYIHHAIKEPVIIERSGSPVVVIVSYERYLELEDTYWGELAMHADKEKSIGKKATMDLYHTEANRETQSNAHSSIDEAR